MSMLRAERLPGTPEPMHRWPGRDGLHIAGDRFGNPSQPALILMHGGGQTRHAWKGTAQHLAQNGFHVITFDTRGHGDSDWSPSGDYDQYALVRDLEQVLEATGVVKPILAGASAGGATALAAVGLERVDARALILVDIVPQTELEGHDRVRSFMLQSPNGFPTLEAAADAIAAFRGSPGPTRLDGLAKNLRKTSDGRYRWHWDPQYLEARHLDLADRHERLSSYARLVRIPTLLIRGGSSDVVSKEGAREFLHLCPHAKYVNVESAGHMLVGDRNDVFGAAAGPFLERIRKDAA